MDQTVYRQFCLQIKSDANFDPIRSMRMKWNSSKAKIVLYACPYTLPYEIKFFNTKQKIDHASARVTTL